MTKTCKDCLFAVSVEDEYFMSCEARQALIMDTDPICDQFEERGCVCEECTTVTPKLSEYENSTAAKYIQDRCGCGCEDDCCNANSYPLDEDNTKLDFMMDDFVTSTDEVTDALAFLGEGTTSRDVLSAILGLEATIAVLKRFLLEFDEK